MNYSAVGLRSLGTALVCGGVLVFQILSTRVLSVVMDEYIILFAISFAMLGMGVATSLMSITRQGQSDHTSRTLCWIGLILGLSYILSLLLVTHLNEQFNENLDVASNRGGLKLVIDTLVTTMFTKMAIVGSVIFFPYFLFGIFIAKLFGLAQPGEYHYLYGADLVGAAAGCILAVLSLDYLGFPGCIVLIVASTFVGAAIFGIGVSRTGVALNGLAGIVAIGALAVPSAIESMEPSPSLVTLARNYDQPWDVDVGWHTWNAHSRIGALTLTKKATGGSREVYAHENGNGWSRVPEFDAVDMTDNAPLGRLANMFKPRRVLVLLAGVGADMVAIDAACRGNCDVTGVEINRHMVEHALSNGDARLRKFFARPNIHLEVAEAREFLERDHSKYDAILISWWGAGTSNYMGTAGKLPQYLYTKEAYNALLDHLTSDGIIIVYNSSKAQALTTLREVFHERGEGSLENDVVILRKRIKRFSDVGIPKPSSSDVLDLDTVERMRLILKPSGFDADDMHTVRTVSRALGSELILFPDGVSPGYEVYRELVKGVDLDVINADLRQKHDIELWAVTDDRPFIDELYPRSKYFSLSAWLDKAPENYKWMLTRAFVQFTLALSVVSLVLILGPLYLRAGPRRTPNNVVRIFYFAALGAGFMAVEVGLVRKLGLTLGHPSYSISIVLASLILSTGLGALASRRLFESGLLTEKRTAALVTAYIAGFATTYPFFVSALIALPLVAKALVIVAMLFPLGFLMGQLFPQGLARAGSEDPQSVPWAWAINGISSTIGSAIAFLFSFALGFDAVLYLGAAIYGAVLVMPLQQRAVEVRPAKELATSLSN